MEDYDELGTHAQIAGLNQRNAAEAAQYYLEEREKGIVDIQLEVDSIKEEIYHLLKQDRLIFGNDGDQTWKEIDLKQRVLTDEGVERIMQVIHFYINKNTLLTNFDDKQIRQIMHTFMGELNDLFLLKYEILFREPTFEECKEIIEKRKENKKKMRMFTLELLGKNYDEKQIEEELKQEMEKTIDKEITKIKTQKRKEKIRDYGLLIAQLEVMVYATLNRAYRGEERGSLRRHMTVSELIGSKPTVPQQSKGGIFSWGRKY